MKRRRITTFLALALGIAAATLTACQGGSGEEADTGFFTGYEIGNEEDQAEIRKDRPDYRPYE